MNACEIEIAIANHYNYRQNIIIPNVYWGLGLHYEADLVILRQSGWATEIEIKTSLQDIKAEKKKRHNHNSHFFRQIYFALPENLTKYKLTELIIEKAGIITIKNHPRWANHFIVKIIRSAKINKEANRFSYKQREKLLHLGCMRIWSLKESRLQQTASKGVCIN